MTRLTLNFIETSIKWHFKTAKSGRMNPYHFFHIPLPNFSLPVLLQELRKTHLVEPPDFTWISEHYIQVSVFEIELIVRKLGGHIDVFTRLYCILTMHAKNIDIVKCTICNLTVNNFCDSGKTTGLNLRVLTSKEFAFYINHIEIAMINITQAAMKHTQRNIRVFLYIDCCSIFDSRVFDDTITNYKTCRRVDICIYYFFHLLKF